MVIDIKKVYKIALFALIIAFMAFAYADSIDLSTDFVVNNTDMCNFNHTSGICNGTRQINTLYYTNESPIQIFVLAHAENIGDILSVNLSINGTVVKYYSQRPLAAGQNAYSSVDAIIPKSSNYSVDISNYHHFEWREYKMLSGANGTLKVDNNYYTTQNITNNNTYNNNYQNITYNSTNQTFYNQTVNLSQNFTTCNGANEATTWNGSHGNCISVSDDDSAYLLISTYNGDFPNSTVKNNTLNWNNTYNLTYNSYGSRITQLEINDTTTPTSVFNNTTIDRNLANYTNTYSWVNNSTMDKNYNNLSSIPSNFPNTTLTSQNLASWNSTYNISYNSNITIVQNNLNNWNNTYNISYDNTNKTVSGNLVNWNNTYNATYNIRIISLQDNQTQDQAYVNTTFEPKITGSTNNVFWNGLKQWVTLSYLNVSNFNTTVQSIIGTYNYITNSSMDRKLSNFTNDIGYITNSTMKSDDLKVNKSGDNMTGMLYINNSSIDKLIFHYIVPSNTTSISVTGLNNTKDGFYDVTLQLTCRVAVGNLYMYTNTDTNNSNYTRQFIYVDGASSQLLRDNSAGISACALNKASTSKLRIIVDGFGKTHYISESGLQTGTNLIFFNGEYSYDKTITTINSLTFTSDVANGIGYNSEIWVYRS